MRSRAHRAIGAVLMIIFCAGCSATPSSPIATPQQPTTTSSATAQPSVATPPPPTPLTSTATAAPQSVTSPEAPTPTAATPAVMPPSGTSLVRRAQADLAARVDVAEEEITVVSVEEREMPLPDLGCEDPSKTPVPGADTPATVMGLEIVLAAAQTEHVYRGRLRQLAYCGPLDAVP